MKKNILLFITLFAVADYCFAQGFSKKNKYWSVGGTLNAMNYVGELDPGPSFISPGIKFTKYNIGAVGMYRIAPRLSARAAFSYGRIKGSDERNSNFTYKGGDIYRKMRNLSFRSQIFEFKVDAVVDFIEHRGRYQKRPEFVPYAFVGLAYFHHNPQTVFNGRWVNLQPLSTEGQGVIDGAPKKYSLHQIAFPIGLGIRYKLSKQLDLAFEIGWRFTTTDYLDDVGGRYVDKAKLKELKGESASLLSDRSWELINQNSVYYDTTGTLVFNAGEYQQFVKKNGIYLDANGNWSVNAYGQGFNGDTNHPLYPNVESGDQRGDKKGRRDAYIITGVHLMYIIPTRVVCPKFRN
ncbi:MAG: DUF6089 family protein [Cytophagaceae bacterium]|nr:DUF6089 family protein [Cytophagaceae bacterium]MDW8455530.1 DUF6089 family protein [Cytophagaceae bacterium]